jgi:hypothetical protein
MPPLEVSFIIVNWNTRELLRECLDSVIERSCGRAVEIIVVDNASTDGSVELVREHFPQVKVIANAENVGFARANNQGAHIAEGRYLLLLNTDAFLKPDALEKLLELANREPKLGMVGAHLLNADGTFQASHTRFPNLAREFFTLSGLGRLLWGRFYPSFGPEVERGPQVIDYVEGACLLAKRETYAQVNGLDEGYFMYSEEVDLCYALRRAGWQVWYHPEACVTHLGGASSQNRKPQREADLYVSRVRFFRKYYSGLAALALKWMIFFFTSVKIVLHAGLRLLSGGKLGRPVVSLSYLISRFSHT